MGITDIEEADLNLWVAANPEVDFGGGPDSLGEVEDELGACGGDVGRTDREGVGSDDVEGEALQG